MTSERDRLPLAEDLRVFLAVVNKQSFAAAATELGQSPAYVSKRIQILEEALSARLLHRSTRGIRLTEEGERAQRWALRILDNFDQFIGDLSDSRTEPRGNVHICSSFGFGRCHVAPAVAELAERYPQLSLRLDLYDRVIDLVAEGVDLEILVGDDIPEQHIGKKLAQHQRILCASPGYLKAHGVPESLEALTQHQCLVLKERDNPFGIWSVTAEGEEQRIRVKGALSSNSGEVVLQWALKHHGIILRSQWDVQPYLDSGELVQVLPAYSQPASVWAVYPTRLAESAKLRVCVEFFQQRFSQLLG
ncbi:MAG: LysR substrate-binding domain-containing protein [Ewingella americana]|jgi:LysR family transcriptional activator of dmlA|uniref:LysR substrate-binding domain-containing protein n=1 Tax=Ewingella americana TaxID=41202 RepID=UPI00242CBA9E|nr:LysR substrate-binding domain-containing protein [Ewingella americana]MCI1677018.1 LysR substrate-binding domain-containing protein [Ewingella americana]MCI1853392.1 LysR substrate-binding domain-containing protein [Ewingella americana]MCI1860367.1 LysR substrate-binding domain-containing protein [Ewingella americana]MCI2141386.1 LysR substrate-binding domain-containing protein [Ewingella americana]MCI2162901.1 LysR substrate-binding domain-containing protein [Ewingella americana]